MILQRHTVSNFTKEEAAAAFKALMDLPKQKYDIYICNAKKSRSAKQRRYYWPVIVKAISDHTGYSPNETNEVLKYKFNQKDLQEPDGRWIKYGASIEAESTARVEQIYAEIRKWAAETMDLQIPEPGELNDSQLISLGISA